MTSETSSARFSIARPRSAAIAVLAPGARTNRQGTRGHNSHIPTPGRSLRLPRHMVWQKKPPGLRRAVQSGTPGRIRTCGLWVRNPTLYPLSYRRARISVHQSGGDPPRRVIRGREGRDSNPRRTFKALNRLAGGPIRPLWHLPRWLCPRRSVHSIPDNRVYHETSRELALSSPSGPSSHCPSRRGSLSREAGTARRSGVESGAPGGAKPAQRHMPSPATRHRSGLGR